MWSLFSAAGTGCRKRENIKFSQGEFEPVYVWDRFPQLVRWRTGIRSTFKGNYSIQASWEQHFSFRSESLGDSVTSNTKKCISTALLMLVLLSFSLFFGFFCCCCCSLHPWHHCCSFVLVFWSWLKHYSYTFLQRATLCGPKCHRNFQKASPHFILRQLLTKCDTTPTFWDKPQAAESTNWISSQRCLKFSPLIATLYREITFTGILCTGNKWEAWDSKD